MAITAGTTGDLLATDPAQVGPYRVLSRLGQGGMGHVYLGRSPGGRSVAIKVIRPDLAAKRGFRARFAREVAAARGVSGMFTAAVVDADPDADLPWMATAFVEGPSLADAVERNGPLAEDAVLSLAAGLAEGLQAIHQAGLVHRDVKPSNVLLAGDGPRVIDFGIAWAREERQSGDRLTDAGVVVGSPGFLSPEQAVGREVGPASDVFSLGAVLAYAATAHEPFGDGATQALMYRVVHEPPDLSRVPAGLRRLVGACLAKEPGHRPTMAQLLDLLAAGSAGLDDVLGPGAAGPPAADPLATPWTPARAMTAIPSTGDRLHVTGSLAADATRADSLVAETWGAAPTQTDLPAVPAEQPADQPRRRRWQPLAAAVAGLGLLAGLGLALASALHGPPAMPGTPGAPAHPVPAGTAPAARAPGGRTASPGQVTPTRTGPAATSPASGTSSPRVAPTGTTPATGPARTSWVPSTAPASTGHPPAQPSTRPPATPAPTSPAPGCVLLCIG